ncbi:MAG: hypothetical protein QOI51_2373 [Nocardioidaceae bacterium]|nr:hypothetical protein [Nocardioidaceae bacterium]
MISSRERGSPSTPAVGSMTHMCTVVVRWDGMRSPQILALRDEITTREFDDPEAWWPDLADVVGGRDRLAGGTWCATRVSTGATALVLNLPHKRQADPGAPSRGRLPLAVVQYGVDWASHVGVDGMASFALVLAAPDRLVSWVFDGKALTRHDEQPGTHMFTSGGAEDGKADRHQAAFESGGYPDGWRSLLRQAAPAADPTALVVRHEHDDDVYATVFGQLVEARPGRLRIEYSRRPWTDDPWTTLKLG